MNARKSLITWLPRGLAIAIAIFLSLFALDAMDGGVGFFRKGFELVKHLVPSWLCLIALVIAWRREWIGGLAFTMFALLYVWWAWEHVDWILLIGLPLLATGVLYFFAWGKRRQAFAR